MDDFRVFCTGTWILKHHRRSCFLNANSRAFSMRRKFHPERAGPDIERREGRESRGSACSMKGRSQVREETRPRKPQRWTASLACDPAHIKKFGGDTLSGHPRLACSRSAPSAPRRSPRDSPCATSGRACRPRRPRHPRRSPARLRLTGFPGAALR